ncbi:MAG: hypothetical protein RLZZ196_178 [Bacteroidota bacterium]|jgi:hypothetical protein
MLGIKDPEDLYEYNYKVCEILSCENEAEDIYSTEEDRIIDVCRYHIGQLKVNHYLW